MNSETMSHKTRKNIAVFGIFPDRERLERCVSLLKLQGFSSDDVSALIPSDDSTHELATVKSSKAPEGGVTGAGTGVVVGGILGWLVGIGSLAIPGVGPFIAAGPIVAMLAGAGVGAAVGGISGSLIGMGIPEYEAKRYEARLFDGGYLLSIHCNNGEERNKAIELLETTGAGDIASTGEAAVPKLDDDHPHIRAAGWNPTLNRDTPHI